MEGGCSALVVLLVDGDGGQAAPHSPFLIDDNLYSGSKVLLKEMGHGRAPNPSSNNSCRQARTRQGGRDGTTGERLVSKALPCAQRRLLAHAPSRLMEFQRGNLQPEFSDALNGTIKDWSSDCTYCHPHPRKTPPAREKERVSKFKECS